MAKSGKTLKDEGEPQSRWKKWKAKFFRNRQKSNLAQIISAVVAAVGLGGIWYSTSVATWNARLSEAQGRYSAYKALTFQHPELVETPPNLEELKASAKNKYDFYTVYVATMLFAYDGMINSDSHGKWLKALDYELKDHKTYLCVIEQDRLKGIYQQIEPIIFAFIKKECPAKIL